MMKAGLLMFMLSIIGISSTISYTEFPNVYSNRSMGDLSAVEVLTPHIYSNIFPFSDDLFITRGNDEAGRPRWGLIDRTGYQIVPHQFDSIRLIGEGLIAVSLGGLYGIIDNSGIIIAPLIYEWLWSSNEGLIPAQQGGRGFLDTEGRVVVPFEYTYVRGFQGGVAAVRSGDYRGMVNKYGKVVVPIMYTDVRYLGDGLVAAAIGGQRGMTSSRGFFVAHDGLLADQVRGGYWGILDTAGNEVAPFIFDSIQLIAPGLIAVRLDGLWGIFDASGSKIVEPIYTHMQKFSWDLILVSADGLWGLLDAAGNEVIPPLFNSVRYLSSGIAAVILT